MNWTRTLVQPNVYAGIDSYLAGLLGITELNPLQLYPFSGAFSTIPLSPVFSWATGVLFLAIMNHLMNNFCFSYGMA